MCKYFLYFILFSSLFQSLSVLGYCMFPILLASIIYCFLKDKLYFTIQLIITMGACVWACLSASAFMGDIVGIEKRGLGLFPICLFYFSFSCYILL